LETSVTVNTTVVPPLPEREVIVKVGRAYSKLEAVVAESAAAPK
jgi:hypothetical protein